MSRFFTKSHVEKKFKSWKYAENRLSMTFIVISWQKKSWKSMSKISWKNKKSYVEIFHEKSHGEKIVSKIMKLCHRSHTLRYYWPYPPTSVLHFPVFFAVFFWEDRQQSLDIIHLYISKNLRVKFYIWTWTFTCLIFIRK